MQFFGHPKPKVCGGQSWWWLCMLGASVQMGVHVQDVLEVAWCLKINSANSLDGEWFAFNFVVLGPRLLIILLLSLALRCMHWLLLTSILMDWAVFRHRLNVEHSFCPHPWGCLVHASEFLIGTRFHQFSFAVHSRVAEFFTGRSPSFTILVQSGARDLFSLAPQICHSAHCSVLPYRGML